MILAKETITDCAREYAMKTVFLPKSSATEAGHSVHMHFSLYDKTSGTGSKHKAFPDYSQKESVRSMSKAFIVRGHDLFKRQFHVIINYLTKTA